MGGTQQFWPPVTVNRIVQTLIYRLAMHPLLKFPLVRAEDGSPIAITKFRNFDGLELTNQSGLTLSVFPYHYTSSDQATVVTVDSDNVGVRFDPHTFGGQNPDEHIDDGQDVMASDLATVNIVLKLHAFGFSQEQTDSPAVNPGQEVGFEMNYIEWMLRQYAEIVAMALRGRHMRRLPRFSDRVPLVAVSFVRRIDYATSAWSTDANLVLHSASILWQAKYYVPREWDMPAEYVPVELLDGNLSLGTYPVAAVPVGVYYDTLAHRYLDADGNTIDRADLTDPDTAAPYATLDADLVSLIDEAPRSDFDFSFYFKRVGGSLPC